MVFVTHRAAAFGSAHNLCASKYILTLLILLSLAFPFKGDCFTLSADEILKLQTALKSKTTGERIALLAEKFVGTPYDTDPVGEYVTRAAITADERVDCMYLIFRSVELALSSTPGEAVQVALDKRFHSKGVLENGRVINYDDRFEYGEDMIYSGKWGREITQEIGNAVPVKRTGGRNAVAMLPPGELLKGAGKLKDGDIVFFVKKPGRRVRGELIGHLGIIKTEHGLPYTIGADSYREYREIYLIHASGEKGKGGSVKKVPLKGYIMKMPFIGAKITRFP
ncbi:MAG: hypothetical protein M1510_05605 [Nitrospirae bacterium]|nr:hypothetical protein [Nitrospirota bacterium]MCL5237366.1 hypothetical protein [Nitrospirota bacterium]